MTNKLVILRGLPGSGKSTWAREWVSGDPAHRAEVNRDMLRMMMHGGERADTQVMVTTASHAAISALLKAGVDVVCSDTNLRQRTARDLARLAGRAGSVFEVVDLTDVPLGVCIGRDSSRSMALGDDKNPVGADVITSMHTRYLLGRVYPLPLPVEDEAAEDADFYVPDVSLPSAVIVDIDGTVALKGARSPYDESRVHEDRPNPRVIDIVRVLHAAGHTIVFMSGRTHDCREATEAWLEEHVAVGFVGPFMRIPGDGRRDSVVKRELFNLFVRDQYNVVAVLDDRDQVVRMWREELGLTCLQVAEGNF